MLKSRDSGRPKANQLALHKRSDLLGRHVSDKLATHELEIDEALRAQIDERVRKGQLQRHPPATKRRPDMRKRHRGY